MNHTTDPQALQAVLTVSAGTRPDGGHYFDQADFTAHVTEWVRAALKDKHAIAEVTIVDQAAELARAQAEAHQYRTALQGVARRAALPSVVVSADRATLLRAAEALHGEAKRLTGEFNDSDILHEDGPAATVATWKHAAEFLRRMAAKEQPADDPLAGYLEELSAAAQAVITPEKTERLLRQIAGRQLPADAEQPDTQTREARLVELRVHYRVQLRDNATADWKPSHPSLDYEDREDADESAAMGREYFPSREYRVVTRTTTITEQP